MMAGHDTHLDGFVRLPNRGFLRLSGPDRLTFLQGLVSNDVNKVAPGQAVYSCLLTPQGKFLHDFFLIAEGESLLIECEADRRADLRQVPRAAREARGVPGREGHARRAVRDDQLRAGLDLADGR